MWANTVLTDGEIAVVAEHSKSEGKPLVYYPKVEVASALSLELSTMRRPAAVDVIDSKEFNLGFTATGAFIAVCLKSFNLQSLVAIVSVFFNHIRMAFYPFGISRALLFSMRQIICSRGSPSFVRRHVAALCGFLCQNNTISKVQFRYR